LNPKPFKPHTSYLRYKDRDEKMKVEAFWEIRNSKGKLEKRIKAKSYIQQLIDLLYVHFAQTTFSMKAIDASNYNIQPNSINFKASADSGDDTLGIQVGSGTDVVLINDFKLKTQIMDGIGGNQLSYGACSLSVPATFGSSRQVSISRTLTNSSGADITVNEVGLAIFGYGDDTNNHPILIERSLLQFVIANGSNKTVTYTIRVTV
jgi:hypothetical protein